MADIFINLLGLLGCYFSDFISFKAVIRLSKCNGLRNRAFLFYTFDKINKHLSFFYHNI